MMDKERGLYGKFKVERTDGRDVGPHAKHDGCDYFVLDLTHDPIAREAAVAYSREARRAGFSQLADDLWLKVHMQRNKSREGN